MPLFLQRLWNVIRRGRLDDDLRQEFDTHIALIEEEERARGVAPDEARRLARSRFGSSLSYRERTLDVVIATGFDQVRKDVLFAARRLVRTPAFTLASGLTLALAIAANVAIFTVVYRVVINPLPYPESGQLIELDHGVERLNMPSGAGMSRGLYYQYANRARTLDAVAVYNWDDLTLSGDGEPTRVRVARVTTTLASVLRVRPAVGRWFSDDEGVTGAPHVAVISYGLWSRRYGRDPGILRRRLILGGIPAEVIGVMPRTYAFPDARVDVWRPEQLSPSMGFGTFGYRGVARLRGGAVARWRDDIGCTR